MQNYEADGNQPIVRSQEDATDILDGYRELAEVIRDSETERILARLRKHGNKLPEAEIIETSKHREWFSALILDEFRTIIEDRLSPSGQASAPEIQTTDMPFFALFLFAEWKVAESVPIVLRALELPDDTLDDLFGDALIEVLPRYLAHFLSSDLDRIDDLIRNSKIVPVLRWTVAESYSYLVHDKLVTVEEASRRLDRLFHETKVRDPDGRPAEKHPFALSSGIAFVLTVIGGVSYSTISRGDEDWDFVDKFVIDAKSFFEELNKPRSNIHNSTDVCTIDELRKWAAFKPKQAKPIERRPIQIDEEDQMLKALIPDPHLGTIRSEGKTPQNSPCPCGSGKKFKHCCLNTSKPAFN